jgi:hypothetical protein
MYYSQLNFATEFMADEAIARAKELDEYYRRTARLVGPLVGDPNDLILVRN